MNDDERLKQQQRIDKANEYVLHRVSQMRTKLLGRLPFFGRLALKLRPRVGQEGDGVDTAAVGMDGTLVVNAEFVKGLTDPQLCFVLTHEVLHPAMLYFDRMQGRIPKLWNMAHDYAINLIIKQMAELPSLRMVDMGDSNLSDPILFPSFPNRPDGRVGRSGAERLPPILMTASPSPGWPRPPRKTCQGSLV